MRYKHRLLHKIIHFLYFHEERKFQEEIQKYGIRLLFKQ